jgi:CopG family nickel-responsive transcriptional regulator
MHGAGDPREGNQATAQGNRVRFSISLPLDVARDLDQIVEGRGFANRSQAVASMVQDQMLSYRSELGDEVMMGLITFIFEHRRRGLHAELTDVQHKYLKEIISIQLVHLEHDLTLQIILVQGPAHLLRDIADDMITRKGVRQGNLQLSAAVLPPLHEAHEHEAPAAAHDTGQVLLD